MSDKALQLDPTRICSLSPTEMNVFRLLPLGLSCSEIAQRLKRSPKTIETHMTRIGHKLGVSGGNRIRVLAIKFDLLPRQDFEITPQL